MDDEQRLRFIAEWFDPSVKVKRSFLLTYFPSDGSVEMYDRQLKRLFLKRIRCENVNFSDMFVGSVVNIFSRQLFISDFADEKTKEKFTKDSESTLCIVKSSGLPHLGSILDALLQNDMAVSKGRFSKPGDEYSKSSFFQHLTPKFAVFEVRGENAINTCKKLFAYDSDHNKPTQTELGSQSTYCICPMSEKEAKDELSIYFPHGKDLHCNTAVLNNSTCCIIKPHAVRENAAGKIIQHILSTGFKITALEFVNFDLPMATEFYEVYKGVVPFYQDMVSQLMSGPSIALEIVKEGNRNIVESFREFAGPLDAEIAKKLRPDTLRARFGHDQVKNAIHCTDLPEDGLLENEYLFRLLAIA